MKAFFEYIGSILITVLPPRYRSSTHLRGPAMRCGIAQTVLMIGILAIRLVLFSREADVLQQSGLTPEIIYEAAGRLGEGAAYGSGIFLVVNFITRPLNAFILYLARRHRSGYGGVGGTPGDRLASVLRDIRNTRRD
jgi:hypothetical protein